MNMPMQQKALQQRTKGAPLIESTPTHLNVPRKRCNGLLGTNCENQENQQFQLSTLTTQQGQQAISTTYMMQQQCHLATTSIQGQRQS
jgi:3,4-dihydroxy-2-butanone 4-phosphate synthase